MQLSFFWFVLAKSASSNCLPSRRQSIPVVLRVASVSKNRRETHRMPLEIGIVFSFFFFQSTTFFFLSNETNDFFFFSFFLLLTFFFFFLPPSSSFLYPKQQRLLLRHRRPGHEGPRGRRRRPHPARRHRQHLGLVRDRRHAQVWRPPGRAPRHRRGAQEPRPQHPQGKSLRRGRGQHVLHHGRGDFREGLFWDVFFIIIIRERKRKERKKKKIGLIFFFPYQN